MKVEQQHNPPTKNMVLNVGPSHPSMHGVIRLVLELDGETIVKTEVEIGYMHPIESLGPKLAATQEVEKESGILQSRNIYYLYFDETKS